MKNPNQIFAQKVIDENASDTTGNTNVFALPHQAKERDTALQEPRVPKPLVLDYDQRLSFPVDALGEDLAQLVTTVSIAMQIPEGLCAMSFLGAINFCARGLFNVSRFGQFTQEPISLFVVSVATSGEGKSLADGIAFQPIDQWERRCLIAGSFPALEHADPSNHALGNLTSLPGTATFGSTTIAAMVSEIMNGNYPNITLRSDEGGIFFGGFSMSKGQSTLSQSILTKAFDSGDFTRNCLSDKEGSGVAFGRRLGIVLAVQPCVFAEAIANPLLASQGFLPRFLITEPESKVGKRVFSSSTVSPLESSEFSKYEKRLSRLLDEPIKVDPTLSIIATPVRFTDDAIDEFYRLANEHEKHCGPDGVYHDEMLAFAARKMQHVRRLATTLAVYYEEATVSAFRVQCAEKIAQHSLDTWMRKVGSQASELALKDAQELYDWLLKNSTSRSSQFKLRDVQRRGPNKLRSDSARLKKALFLLSQHNWLTLDDKNTVTAIQRV